MGDPFIDIVLRLFRRRVQGEEGLLKNQLPLTGVNLIKLQLSWVGTDGGFPCGRPSVILNPDARV